MNLVIGGIIHERDEIPSLLQSYVTDLARIQTGGLDVQYVWVVDSDSLLLGETLLTMFPGACIIHPNGVSLESHYKRGKRSQHSHYAHLASLRNMLSAKVLELGADALLSVDSDILVPSDLVQNLKASERPWVAALVRNHPAFLHLGTQPSDSIEDQWWNVFWFPWQEGKPVFAHFKPTGIGPDGAVWPSDVSFMDPWNSQHAKLGTGAVCWYSRALLEQVQWATQVPSPGDPTGEQCRGEDIGFSIRAFEAGFFAWYIPLICDHIMDSYAMERHKQSCLVCASTI